MIGDCLMDESRMGKLREDNEIAFCALTFA